MYDINSVKLIDWDMIETELLGGDLAEQLELFINRSIKYMLGKWWSNRGFIKQAQEEYLPLKGSYDKIVRPCIHIAKTIGLALRFGVYDEKTVGKAEYVGRDRFIKLIRSCAYQHVANMQDGWGGSAESLSGVYELTLVSWVAWEKLNIRDKTYILNMLEYELTELEGEEPLYYYMSSGMPFDRTLSTVYYNTAVANLCQLAVCMMPEHRKATLWRAKANDFYHATYLTDSEAKGESYNLDEEYILTSYGTKSPVATGYIGSVSKSYIMSKLVQEEFDADIVRHYADIYKAFYNTSIDEKGVRTGEFVTFDKKQRPNFEIKCAEGKKMASIIEAQTYLMDICAFCLDIEPSEEFTNRQWTKERMKTLLYRQRNGNSSYCMQAPQFDRNTYGESIASLMMDGYITLFFYATANGSQVDNKHKYIEV